MYCAGCGASLSAGDEACPRCGRLAGPPVAGANREDGFARTVRMLSRFYMYFAAVNVVLGIFGLFAVQTGLSQAAGPWEPWPHPPLMAWTYVGAAAWSLLVLRVITAAAAWQALGSRAECGRPVGIVAAVVALTQFPIGLLLGAFTLVELTGRRRAAQYATLMRA